MSEITREEVKQHVQRAVESWERRAEWCADRAAHGDPSGAPARAAALHTAAIYRLALAALEDAARYAYMRETFVAGAERLDDRDLWRARFCVQAEVSTVRLNASRGTRDEAFALEFDAAIDRARGG